MKRKEDDKKDEDKTDEENPAPPVGEKAKKKYKMELRNRTITHTVPLKLTSIDDVLEVKAMSKDDLKLARTRFKDYLKMEKERLALATARNDLETLIYSSKEKLNDNDEAVNKVMPEDWLDEYSTTLSDKVDWLYFEDEANEIKNVKALAKEIKDKVKTVFLKISESVDRPKAVKVAGELIAATRAKMKAWPKNRPQVTEQEIKDLEAKLSELEKFLTEKTEAQKKLTAKDEAAFSSKDVSTEINRVGNLLKRLLKKAPLPPPEEEEDEEEKAETPKTDSDTDTTNPDSDADAKTPEKEEEGKGDDAKEEPKKKDSDKSD